MKTNKHTSAFLKQNVLLFGVTILSVLYLQQPQNVSADTIEAPSSDDQVTVANVNETGIAATVGESSTDEVSNDNAESSTNTIEPTKEDNATENKLSTTDVSNGDGTNTNSVMPEDKAEDGKNVGTTNEISTAITTQADSSEGNTVTATEIPDNPLEIISELGYIPNQNVGQKKEFDYAIKPEYESLVYTEVTVDDPAILSIYGDNGLVGMSVGNTNVNFAAYRRDNSELLFTIPAPISVEEGVPANNIAIKADNTALRVGDTSQLESVLTPSNATGLFIIWSSSDPSVATVDQNGLVTALTEGTVQISAKTYVSGLTATIRLNIANPVSIESVAIAADNTNLVSGDSEQLQALVEPAINVFPTLQWSTSDKNVLSVDANGKVMALNSGTAVITVVATDSFGNAKTNSLSFNVSASTEQETQDIFSIEAPTWITDTGMHKGSGHDRQDLGFELAPGATLAIRQINSQFTDDVNVRLIGNDGKYEKSIRVGSDWQTISGDVLLVPFVDTPYGTSQNEAKIEYKIFSDTSQMALPIYNYGDDQDAFYRQWDENNGGYALIKGNSFQFLVPDGAKDLAENLVDFNNLDALIDYYEAIFATYNRLAGLDNSSYLNRNSDDRYFMKADADTKAGAYYGSAWIADGSSTASVWLTINSWGLLHEIGHGYQPNFGEDNMGIGEVLNNIFALDFQYEYFGKETTENSWLFDFGNQETIEGNLYADMMNGVSFKSLDNREKLILLAMVVQKAGKESLTNVYQNYRRLATEADFYPGEYPNVDLFNKYFSENTQLDFSAIFEKWGLTIDQTQAAVNRYRGYEAVASLADVIPENMLAQARELLDPTIPLNSNFELVTNDDLVPLGLSGDLKLSFDSDDSTKLDGITVSLVQGNDVIKTGVISDGSISFTDLPNGVYTLSFDGGQINQLRVGNYYVYVKEANNEATIDLNTINSSPLSEQSIDFLGLGDANFATLTTDFGTSMGSLTVKFDPHSYFAGETYATVTVKNTTGQVIYSKVMQGTDVEVGTDTFELKEGYTIDIFHAETEGRLVSGENLVDKTSNTNTFTVTKFGLQNATLLNDPEQDFINRIDVAGNELFQDRELYAMPMSKFDLKKALYSAINSLDEQYQAVYMAKYGALFDQTI